ncbi:hypothetical protein [Streptomyces sp. ME18-1-4]|uniref:MmyB family transcriptional regulator n=1 Tax=Streptomyces sp. ME18-1-4 TaxID=3028685 RepID=UPI0029BF45D5|nr:hypothetical protein [Streptomyces sp. ME18-1-4]MDX3240882.1 hypothetical protein [Streptomyces sp. ME18-1-4]
MAPGPRRAARWRPARRASGIKNMRHPLVGDPTLSFEIFLLADDSDQALITHHAEPGSPSAEALRLLASWGADAMRAGSDTSAPSA